VAPTAKPAKKCKMLAMSGQMYYFSEIEGLPLGLSVLNVTLVKERSKPQ
jgi:hypothetical protein